MVSFLITSHHNSPLAWLRLTRLTVHRSSGSCWSHPIEPVGLGVFPKDSGFFCCPKMDGFKIMEKNPYWILMDDLGGKLPPLLFGNILISKQMIWKMWDIFGKHPKLPGLPLASPKTPENFQAVFVVSWIFLFVGLPTCLNIQRF